MSENGHGTTVIGSLKDLQSFIRERDNWQNIFYMTPISDLCKEYPCILGIDEAGRGPVLGPMVYGTAFIPINEQTLLETLECADSKALTEEKRDVIFEKICENHNKLGWGVEIIAPNTICNSMLSRSKYSLNQVSMDAAIGLIKAALAQNVKIEHVYVDTVGKPEKYQQYLKTIFPNLKITVAKKADSTYPVVSAAKGIEVSEFGSGYPGDPITKKFLSNHCEPVFGYPQLVRFSWSTASTLLKDIAYHIECEEDDGEKTPPATQNNSITAFFKMTNKGGTKAKTRHIFFKQRHLSRNVEF
ncbi:hypothetical protein GWI33_009198 [Rhynchophorus ferrugineus]|uniref:Ribonuclease n=1 Tax=Rhynchophorus ferrugineus TaxID=354439 RepID=A0A834IH35_RHYFE|nr:hypothetical protein GWI33_009198 [Rhynchophorus ferrugineus]